MCGLFCTLIENGIKLLNSYANLVKSHHKKIGMGLVTIKYSNKSAQLQRLARIFKRKIVTNKAFILSKKTQ